MSIMDKIKELFGGTAEKLRDIPEQGSGDMTGRGQDTTQGGVDRGAEWGKEHTGGQYDENIDSAADRARERYDDPNP